MNDPEEDDPSPYSVIQSSFNFTEPKKLTKVLFLTDYYKKIKAPNPRPHFNVVETTNQNLLWDNLTQSPNKFIFMRMTLLLIIPPTETSTQTMVHECLSDGGMDPSDINNVMSVFKFKAGKPPQQT